ncbi:hypothetical protein GRX01_11515 [Halobaculum sp. WSA2]|uniref:Uncharacterized protein n=1 Tax=Halobaculum saliterrae TaxID=2073113 RepID=A0A6B0T132_9EURY|nr:hypothetical protein [Halobaculum saliterrae]MXR41960.1 hypothetical protein [Halobaculum saliterrae]
MRQDLVLASLLAGMGVAVLPGVLTFYLAAGPSVWLATGAVVAATGLVFAYSADDADEADEADEAADASTSPKVNCPECGARAVADGTGCAYCGAALPV